MSLTLWHCSVLGFKRPIFMLLCFPIAACTFSPVIATQCAVRREAGNTLLTASANLANTSSKTVLRTEVLFTTAGEQGTGAVLGYVFSMRLRPGEARMVGAHAPHDALPVSNYVGRVTECATHIVWYEDRTIWEGPSPL